MRQYLLVLFFLTSSFILLSQSIVRVDIKLLPCLVKYDHPVTIDNFLEHTISFDTSIVNIDYCQEIKDLTLELEFNKTCNHFIDARIFFKCFIDDGNVLIFTSDYYGRCYFENVHYGKNEELIMLLKKYIPFVEDCIKRQSGNG
jgi:hypothetical protein